jgi:hypothetical protein
VPEYLTNLLRRPPVGWWGSARYRHRSFIFYEFLKLIRGNPAVQMAAGSLLIVGLFYLSRLVPLQTRQLDDPEHAGLRRLCGDRDLPVGHPARARALRQAPFFRYFNRQEAANETIEELVVAATMLSSQQTGRSSPSSARSACATTSRAAFPSTPR